VFNASAAQLAAVVADPRLRAVLGCHGRQYTKQRSWKRAADSLVELLQELGDESQGATTAPPRAVPPPPLPRSMVDGLASTYLEDDPRLRFSAASADGRRRRQALRMVADALPPPYRIVGTEDEMQSGLGCGRPAWHPAPKVRRRALLELAAAAGSRGVAASVLGTRTGLPDAESHWLLLQLIRYGMLDVVPASTTT
jgi:hypothetical protein